MTTQDDFGAQDAVLYFGRTGARVKIPLTRTPPQIQLWNVLLDRLDDPDTGEFMGAYIARDNSR